MAKESVEKNRSDDLKAMMKRAEQREVELNIMIDTLEQRNGRRLQSVEQKFVKLLPRANHSVFVIIH